MAHFLFLKLVVFSHTRWQHTPLDEARTFGKTDVIEYLEDYVKNPPEVEKEETTEEKKE